MQSKFAGVRRIFATVAAGVLVPAWVALSEATRPPAAADRPASTSRWDVTPTLEGRTFLTSRGSDWKLLWHDEFDGDQLDSTQWSLGLPWVGDDGTHRHHNDQYASYIEDDDVAVGGGTLKLLTRKQDVTDAKGKTYHYTQGFIHTDGKFAYTYGYSEVRCKVPVEAGPGLWPAFWTLSKGWPPENDIAEFWTPTHLHQGFAYRNDKGKVAWTSTHVRKAPIPSGFHTYGLEWGPGYELFNIDGKITNRVYGAHVPDVPMYLLLNSGVSTVERPDETTRFPNAFEVDYVRVYQRPPSPLVLDGGFEDEGLGPWGKWNDVSLVTLGAHGGRQALRLTGAPASSEQTIYGLKPDTRYTLSAWAKAAAGNEARLGVKDYGGEEKYATITSPAYTQASVTFTTAADAKKATIYCFKSSGTGAAFFDDVEIKEEPAK